MRPSVSILRLARWVRSNVRSRLAEERPEGGAVVVVVALLLGLGVVLGCAALSIDTGALLWERRQLQNGADATSLAVAQSCATTTPCVPDISPAGALAGLAGANAADGRTAIDSVCGSATTVASNPALALCPTPGGTPPLVECPAAPPALVAANYVEVRTRTLTTSGSTILPPYFAQTLAGGTYAGESVGACARAAWVPPTSFAAAVPVTFSYCEWQEATGYDPTATPPNPGTYAPNPAGAAPGYGGAGQPAWPSAATPPPPPPAASGPPPSVPGEETIIMLAQHPNSGSCPNWNGHDTAGGFGYLSSAGCATVVTTGGWVQVDTGSSSPCDLAPFYQKVIYLPVFDCVVLSGSAPVGPPDFTGPCNTGAGSNTWYHIEGFAKFYLSGYKTGGGPAATRVRQATGTEPCSGSDRCLSGWFLQGLVPVSGPPGPPPPGPALGISVVQVAG